MTVLRQWRAHAHRFQDTLDPGHEPLISAFDSRFPRQAQGIAQCVYALRDGVRREADSAHFGPVAGGGSIALLQLPLRCAQQIVARATAPTIHMKGRAQLRHSEASVWDLAIPQLLVLLEPLPALLHALGFE